MTPGDLAQTTLPRPRAQGHAGLWDRGRGGTPVKWGTETGTPCVGSCPLGWDVGKRFLGEKGACEGQAKWPAQ